MTYRPTRRPRADDDYYYGPTLLGIGVVHAVAAPDEDDIAGVVLVPDPEARRAWREHPVHRSSARVMQRPIGFRPRMGR